MTSLILGFFSDIPREWRKFHQTIDRFFLQKMKTPHPIPIDLPDPDVIIHCGDHRRIRAEWMLQKDVSYEKPARVTHRP
ncbi:hypothetical protein SCFA_80006 [anaerobic digester metagenome]|uniref:Uncharacterized protein n=1 Tax=anaerobic digester metagenome TaxID=1263854 RepID=A0A485M4Q3_9ZZZZ